MHDEVVSVVNARHGHFLLESGHHGELWLDLELLCLKPTSVQRFAVDLAARLSRYHVEAVCGPLVEGAFVALMVASELNVEFSYAERFARAAVGGLYPVEYRIPRGLRARARGRRIAIVNDVINAGSAVRGTFADLEACGAVPVAIGALLILGDPASTFAAEKNVPLESNASLPNAIWTPSECPLCASGVPVDNH